MELTTLGGNVLTSLSMAKLAAQAVAGLGVSKILGDIIKNNVIIATTAQKVTVKIGTIVLGSMLVEQTANHIERAADDAVALVEKLKDDDKKPDLKEAS